MGITFMMCFAVLSALFHCSAGGVVFNYMIHYCDFVYV